MNSIQKGFIPKTNLLTLEERAIPLRKDVHV